MCAGTAGNFLSVSWAVEDDNYDIRCCCTPVRSEHQRRTPKLSVIKEEAGIDIDYRRWTLANLFLSTYLPASSSVHHFLSCVSFFSLCFPHPLCALRPPVYPSLIIYLFADLFILHSFSCRDAAPCAGCYHHSFTPSPEQLLLCSSLQRYLGAGGVTLVKSNGVLIPLDN